ncbi:hypothetical protein ACEPAI_2779 [Sanghuangporus weigelae]
MITSTFASFLSLAVSVAAFDYGGTPCHNGECYYNIPGNEKYMAATVKISGSPSSISDITNAAGWEIINCSFDGSTHNVRLVCLDDDAGCSHIFKDGTEHTIVRLPQYCGNGPFARVSKSWISEDQFIPQHIRARMRKRSEDSAPVHALRLDGDFGQASDSNKGNVSIFIYASATQRLLEDTLPHRSRRHARDVYSRALEDTISEEFDILSSLLTSEDGFGPFIRNTTKNTIPINVDQKFKVFNTSLPCTGSTDAKLSVDADVNLQGEMDLGVIAQGTIIPPKFNKFGLFGSWSSYYCAINFINPSLAMSADLVGKLSIATDISGRIDTPEITFVNIGLPGLSIPDVISLGPSISLAAKATANFDINMNLDVGLGYSVSDLTIFFPPSVSHNSSAVIVPNDIPLQLSVAPGIQSATSLTVHLIPSVSSTSNPLMGYSNQTILRLQLNLGLVAFDVSTAAFLNFDTSATLELHLNAGANANVDTSSATEANGEVDGCVDVKGGISVNVGLEADSPLFDLLGDAATITLAEKELDFFQQCFPDTSGSATVLPLGTGTSDVPATATPVLLNISPELSAVPKGTFSCPANLEAVESTVVNKTLSSDSVPASKNSMAATIRLISVLSVPEMKYPARTCSTTVQNIQSSECASVPFAHVASCRESDDQSMPDHVKSRIMRCDGAIPPVHALSFNVNFDEIPPSQHGNVFWISDFRTKSTDLPSLNIDQSFNIFNTTLSCSVNEEAKLSVDVNAKLNEEVTIGTVLAGSLIPPKLKEFDLFSDVSADLEGGLSIDANIAGQIDTGKIPLFTVGLPGLSIPGIFSLGPSFEIDSQALATIDLDVTMDVDLAYSFSDLQLFFSPSDNHPFSAVVVSQDAPLKLSASPNVESNATLEAQLIPTLKFGLEVLGTNASIFLDLDAFAALDLGLVTGAAASVDSTGATNASAQVGGCVDVNGGVQSMHFDLFMKCFEKSTSNPSSVTTLVTSTVASLTSSASVNATVSHGGQGISESTSVENTEVLALVLESNDAASDSVLVSTSLASSGSIAPFRSSSLVATSVANEAQSVSNTLAANTATAVPTTAVSDTRTSSTPKATGNSTGVNSSISRGRGWDVREDASVVDQVLSSSRSTK